MIVIPAPGEETCTHVHKTLEDSLSKSGITSTFLSQSYFDNFFTLRPITKWSLNHNVLRQSRRRQIAHLVSENARESQAFSLTALISVRNCNQFDPNQQLKMIYASIALSDWG